MLIKYPRRVTVYHKNYFGNIISSCKCPVGAHHVGMISNFPSKTVVGVDQPVKALTCKKKTKKKCLSSHSCNFVKNYFFRKNISSCKCPRGVHHVGMISNCSIKKCGKS